MRLIIAAIGRLKSGPEAGMTADYIARTQAAGKPLKLGPAELIEGEAAVSGDRAREAEILRRAAPAGAIRVLLDERGANWTSVKLAEQIAAWRDAARPAAVFWIGGADGALPALADEADAVIAFGAQTWPHRLVRVMLAEQIYRAVTILAGGPYHRA